MQGYLLKRNKEHRKANFLGVKYKKRWVEVTSDTLVYSKSQQELLSGRIQVFAVRDLVWVRAEAEAKLVVKFKERTLTFKVEDGSSAERDKWVSVLQTCKQQASGLDSQKHPPSGKLGQLIKVAEQQLVDVSHPSPHNSSTGGVQPPSPRSIGTAAPSSTIKALNSDYTKISQTPVPQTPASSHTSAAAARPLSPRSMLASAKLGSAFVTSTLEAGGSSQAVGCSVTAGQQQKTPFCKVQENSASDDHLGADECFDDEDDCDDDVTSASERHECKQIDGRYNRPGTGAGSQQGKQGAVSSFTRNSPVGPTPNKSILEHGDSSSLDSSVLTQQQQRDKRATLTRRLTPGVMLLNIGDPADTVPSSTTSTTASGPGVTADRPTSHSASHHTQEAAQSIKEQQQSHHESSDQPAPAKHNSDSDDDLDSGILRLEPNELVGYSKQSSATGCKPKQQHLCHGNISGTVSTSNCYRPASAPYASARPNTALKSCLRKGGGGSRSTPTRSSALVVSAEAALHCMQQEEGPPFQKHASSKLSTPLHCDISREQPNEGQPSISWLQEDWDSGDCEESSGMSAVVATRGTGLGNGSSNQHHDSPQLSEHHLAAGSSGRGSSAAASCIGISGASLGVKADNSWLDDDFDA